MTISAAEDAKITENPMSRGIGMLTPPAHDTGDVIEFSGGDSREGVFTDDQVRNYLPLVRQVVQRMMPRRPAEVQVEDLVSWGTLGLLDAMRKFNPEHDASFATYAQYRIRGSILDYLRRCDWMPRSVRQKGQELDAATRRLEGRLGRSPVDEEIAHEMNLGLQEYTEIVAMVATPSMVSLEDVGFGRGEQALVKDVEEVHSAESGPARNVLQNERARILARAIDDLPEKERIVVSFYYYEGLTMREMADAMELTEGRISQLHSQAMGHLRDLLADSRPEISFS